LPSSGKVVSVFDGDTILLDTGEKVRYLGIDAPEVAHEDHPAECYGTKAKKANGKWVFNKRVTLRYDREKKDRYGRLLAYVFSPEGKCVNEEMLRAGYAFVFKISKGFERFKSFLSIQRGAMRNRRGMWGACTVKLEDHYRGNRNSFIFHRPECPFGKRTSKKNRIRFETRESAFEEGYRPCRRCKP
jgi:micrococcal nuclease